MMRATIRHPKRAPVIRPIDASLPDGAGGTISGGPVKPLDLTNILGNGQRDVGLGGAVSGAARVAGGSLRVEGGREPPVSLPDGTRITFASVDHGRALTDS